MNVDQWESSILKIEIYFLLDDMTRKRAFKQDISLFILNLLSWHWYRLYIFYGTIPLIVSESERQNRDNAAMLEEICGLEEDVFLDRESLRTWYLAYPQMAKDNSRLKITPLAPANFSGAVFTHAHFQKNSPTTYVSSLCDFHYLHKWRNFIHSCVFGY